MLGASALLTISGIAAADSAGKVKNCPPNAPHLVDGKCRAEAPAPAARTKNCPGNRPYLIDNKCRSAAEATQAGYQVEGQAVDHSGYTDTHTATDHPHATRAKNCPANRPYLNPDKNKCRSAEEIQQEGYQAEGQADHGAVNSGYGDTTAKGPGVLAKAASWAKGKAAAAVTTVKSKFTGKK